MNVRITYIIKPYEVELDKYVLNIKPIFHQAFLVVLGQITQYILCWEHFRIFFSPTNITFLKCVTCTFDYVDLIASAKQRNGLVEYRLKTILLKILLLLLLQLESHH